MGVDEVIRRVAKEEAEAVAKDKVSKEDVEKMIEEAFEEEKPGIDEMVSNAVHDAVRGVDQTVVERLIDELRMNPRLAKSLRAVLDID